MQKRSTKELEWIFYLSVYLGKKANAPIEFPSFPEVKVLEIKFSCGYIYKQSSTRISREFTTFLESTKHQAPGQWIQRYVAGHPSLMITRRKRLV